MNEEEIPLQGGQSTDVVVRIGNTVRRSMQPNAEFIHKLLQHLEKTQFAYAPRFLGIDEQQREILTFIDGEVPRGLTLSLPQLIACIKILRRLHDAAATFDLCEGAETICHNDFAPWNVVFKNNVPVGIIDFDDAKKGKRVEDVAYFLWTFLELGNAAIPDEQQISSIGVLCQAYHFEQPPNLVDAILQQQERILLFRKEKAAKNDSFSREAVGRIETEMAWVRSNRDRIQYAILHSSSTNQPQFSQ
ncbi:MAG: aminoglycoside phosphotransferase family protein [Bacteroidota bacterium]